MKKLSILLIVLVSGAMLFAQGKSCCKNKSADMMKCKNKQAMTAENTDAQTDVNTTETASVACPKGGSNCKNSGKCDKSGSANSEYKCDHKGGWSWLKFWQKDKDSCKNKQS